MILEVCASNYQSAINAQKAGAQRIELCEDLSVGGLTPNKALAQKVMQSLKIPVFVLIRPRAGNFEYTQDEFDVMKENISYFKSLGVSGIVSGVLASDLSIDIPRTEELIAVSRPLPFTFHRAFDTVVHPFEALEVLIDLGTDRILSSGQKKSAVEGIELLEQLNAKAKSRIIIMPGAGIDPTNAYRFKNSGFKEIHASARAKDSVSNSEIISQLLKTINA